VQQAFKIAMVAASPFPYPQGSQVLISQLAAALQRRGHSVRMVAYPRGLGQPPEGVPIHRVPSLPGLTQVPAGPSWRRPLLDLLLAGALLRTVRDWQADIIHAHNFEGLLAALYVRRRTRVPVVYHIHNAMSLELHTYFHSRLGRWAGGVLGRWVDNHLPRQADHCIVLNEAAPPYFQQRGVERMRVIPPGIDLEPGDSVRGRAHLGKGPLVLYAGNLDRYQDLNLLFQACRLVLDSWPEAKLVLSTHSEPGAWKTRIEALGIGQQTVFARAQDMSAASDLLAAADVAVCPRTVCLGFPIKLLNYMAAGKAIVASAGSACGLEHLETIWVVDDGDVPAMAAAITGLLADRDLAHRLGARAQQTAESKYTWDRAVDAVTEVYTHTLEQADGLSPERRQS
jgi:glycosyltransferase involved in cell wall biosynthesis